MRSRFLSQVPNLPGANHDPARRSAGDAAVVPGEPAARPDGQAEEGGHSQVLHAPDPGMTFTWYDVIAPSSIRVSDHSLPPS